MKHIAIFASGSGSNAQKIMEHFQNHPRVKVSLIISNKKNAGVLERAAAFDVPTHFIQRSGFYNPAFSQEDILEKLNTYSIDLLVLAGFLWLIPEYLVKAFPNRIVNIHPALLPKYGGKGMYGIHVHRAVKAAGERESGMTIHFVNEKYDEGAIIFQAKCLIEDSDSAEDIAKKVLQLEHKHYAKVIEQLLL